VLSLVDHVRRGYRPRNTLVAKSETGGWRHLPLDSLCQYEPGLIAYRFSHSLYYANAGLFAEQIAELANNADPDLRWLCLDAVAIDDVDYSGAAALRSAHQMLKEKGIRLVLAMVSEHTRKELDRHGVSELVGRDAFFDNGDAVIAAFRQTQA
jgi:SulP family sulfate permease